MKLKTPVERYNNDPHFRNLVKYMEALIHQAQFTPSELREAVMLAAINYEMSRLSTVFMENDNVNNAIIKKGDVWHYAKASIEAMRRYARVIEEHDPELSRQLFNWAKKEQEHYNSLSLTD